MREKKMIISHWINDQIELFSMTDHKSKDAIKKRGFFFFLSTGNDKYKRINELMKQTLTTSGKAK